MLLLSLRLAEPPSTKFADLFASCMLCGACEQACSRGLPIRAMVMEMRERFSALYGKHGLQKFLVRKSLIHSRLLDGLVKAGVSMKRIRALPADSGLRRKLGLLEDRDGSQLPQTNKRPPTGSIRGEVFAYFPGCLAQHLQPSVARATGLLVEQLTGQPLHIPEQLNCCGLAASAAGDEEDSRQLARSIIRSFEKFSGPILTSCASCSSHLQEYPLLFADEPRWYGRARAFSSRVKEFTSFFLERAGDLQFTANTPLSVFYHDPCHLRFTEQGRKNPRRLIDMVENITRIEPEGGPLCCGQGGLFHLGYPELADRIFTRSMERALTKDPQVLTTTCSGCLMQWQERGSTAAPEVVVYHLALLLAESLVPGRRGKPTR